jgi:DNA-binding protein HU-beta
MNKAELIDTISTSMDLPRGQAERLVNAVFDEIVAAMKRGDKVNLSGFGTFVVSDRAARTGRNPKTGEPIDIPASKAPKFRAGKALKDMLN